MFDDTLIETICIRNGRVQRIRFHNARCNRSRKTLLGIDKKIDLRKYIDTSKALAFWTKCRITYSSTIIKVEYEPYSLRTIETLSFVDIDDYQYNHKYKQREKLDAFFRQKQESDDIIMIRSGKVTDSYYANIALQKEGIWYTPKTPLLKGTMRAYLISNNKIVEKDIYQKEVKEYKSVSLFNAMIALGTIVVSTDKIK